MGGIGFKIIRNPLKIHAKIQPNGSNRVLKNISERIGCILVSCVLSKLKILFSKNDKEDIRWKMHSHKSVNSHLFTISWSNNEALVKYFLRFYFLCYGNIAWARKIEIRNNYLWKSACSLCLNGHYIVCMDFTNTSSRWWLENFFSRKGKYC